VKPFVVSSQPMLHSSPYVELHHGGRRTLYRWLGRDGTTLHLCEEQCPKVMGEPCLSCGATDETLRELGQLASAAVSR
jgi:hypothetical protein